MLITAAKTARYRKLADDLDAALGRGDDIGMDLLRTMLPEIGEAIEEINEALRETDALLFEGLRDEAIALHDPELASVAIRLNLEDKPQWQMAALFFESEGIRPPPAIDFEALASLNTAFAELDQLRKPLDKLRRLALERAPLPSKISLLRKLRQNDSGKPVWNEQLTAHEEVRVLELGDAVKRAFASRDPDKIASLHKELTNPDWSIPVSQRLKRDTEGGSIWRSLRKAVRELEVVASELAGLHSTEDPTNGDGLDRVDKLRGLRQQWVEGESHGRKLLFAIPQHPAIATLVQQENFGPRLDELRDAVKPALAWLAQIDERERITGEFARTANELEYLVEHLPAHKKQEGTWLGKMEKLSSDMQQLCQQLPTLTVPELLRTRIERAVADVRGRSRSRSRTLIAATVCALVLAGLGIAAAWKLIEAQRFYGEAMQYVQSLLPPAEQGEFVVRPERLDQLADVYQKSPEFSGVLEHFDRAVDAERKRRDYFDGSLAEHATLVDSAMEAFAKRQETPGAALEDWPSEVFDALDKYSQARVAGGFPWERTGDPTPGTPRKQVDDSKYPPAAKQRWRDEDTKLATHESRQSEMLTSYENAAAEEFKRRLTEIQGGIPDEADGDAKERAQELLRQCEALVENAKQPRSSRTKRHRVPYETRQLAEPLRLRLEKLSQ
jgi:hypothetical protein